MKSGGFPAYISHYSSQLLKLLFPPACPLCSSTFPYGYLELLCPTCQAGVVSLPSAHCTLCALPFTGHQNSSHLCGRCIKERPEYTKVFAVGLYEKSLRLAIHQFKFNQRIGFDRLLGVLLDHAVDSELKIDIVVPVPLSPLRLRQRGYNQSLLLACEFSRLRNLPVKDKLLCKIRETKEQHGLSARERETNLKDAFALQQNLSGETVLLIDDVLTTGKTVATCAQILKQGGAGEIYVAVIARAA